MSDIRYRTVKKPQATYTKLTIVIYDEMSGLKSKVSDRENLCVIVERDND